MTYCHDGEYLVNIFFLSSLTAQKKDFSVQNIHVLYWGESDSPGFYKCCVQQFMQFFIV